MCTLFQVPVNLNGKSRANQTTATVSSKLLDSNINDLVIRVWQYSPIPLVFFAPFLFLVCLPLSVGFNLAWLAGGLVDGSFRTPVVHHPPDNLPVNLQILSNLANSPLVNSVSALSCGKLLAFVFEALFKEI